MIRQAEENQLAECVQVIRESFLTVADAFGFTMENAPGFTAFATTMDRLRWQMYGEKRPMFVCMAEDRVVGYYSLLVQEGNGCELNNLCVLPSHRHQGIGAQLLNHAFQTARALQCPIMHIGIVEENRQLRAWYESFGFVHTGTKKFDAFPFTCGYMEKVL